MSGEPLTPADILVARFAAGVAHELNNASNILAGYLHLLRGASREGDAIEEMEAAVSRLRALSQRLARLGDLDLEAPARLDLNAIARSAAAQLPPPPADLDLEEGLPAIWGRSGAATAAVAELLRNVRSAGGGGAGARIETRSLGTGGARLTVEGPSSGAVGPEGVLDPRYPNAPRKAGLGLAFVGAFAATHHARCELDIREAGGFRVSMLFPPADRALAAD